MSLVGIVGVVAAAGLVCARIVRVVGKTGSATAGRQHSRLGMPRGVSMMATAAQHGMRDESEQRQDMGGRWKHVDQP